MMPESKTDKIVWWILGVLLSIILIGGSAWAASINTKVERIAALEVSIDYIRRDISEIKSIIKEELYNNKGYISK